MTPERYFTLALIIAVAILIWIAFGGQTEQEIPPIDPETYRIEERQRIRDLEVIPAQMALDSVVKLLELKPTIRYVRAKGLAKERMELSDSLQAKLLIDRLK
jgi:hypothetical protein